MKKHFLTVLIVSMLAVTVSYCAFLFKLIPNLPLSEHFLWTGIALAFIGAMAFFGGSIGPKFENEFHVQRDLIIHEAEERNMIESMKNGELSKNARFTIIMILSSAPLFLLYVFT